MPIQVFIIWVLGVVFIYFGYLIFTMKVPTLLDYFLKTGVNYHDKRVYRFCGSIIIAMGIFIILSPFIFGIEQMNM